MNYNKGNNTFKEVYRIKKQFSKKGIEKLFYATYSKGEICLDGSTYDWWWTPDIDNIKIKDIRANNLYDVAEKLNLVSPEEIAQMKKLAGYRSYQ